MEENKQIQQKEEVHSCVKKVSRESKLFIEGPIKLVCKNCGKTVDYKGFEYFGLDNIQVGFDEYYLHPCNKCGHSFQFKIKIKSIKIEMEIE